MTIRTPRCRTGTGTISQATLFAILRPAIPTSPSSESPTMMPDDLFRIADEVRLWLDPDGAITLSALTRDEGDPVELSSADARRLAAALNALADQDDAD